MTWSLLKPWRSWEKSSYHLLDGDVKYSGIDPQPILKWPSFMFPSNCRKLKWMFQFYDKFMHNSAVYFSHRFSSHEIYNTHLHIRIKMEHYSIIALLLSSLFVHRAFIHFFHFETESKLLVIATRTVCHNINDDVSLLKLETMEVMREIQLPFARWTR